MYASFQNEKCLPTVFRRRALGTSPDAPATAPVAEQEAVHPQACGEHHGAPLLPPAPIPTIEYPVCYQALCQVR
ncbi:hypothetical protein CLJ1_4082 [Pseudomonas paraeruginosa]|nr:hypothetical protein CLJ1_4082 [Pseudomonas aeruginosa]